MTLSSVMAYLFLISLALVAIFISFRMYQNYQLKYLFYYFICLVLYYGSAFLYIVANFLTLRVLGVGNFNISAYKTMGMVFSLLAFPFLFLAWFFFILMTLTWVGKSFSARHKIFYFIFHIALFIFYAYTLNRYVSDRDLTIAQLASNIIFLFQAASHLLLCLICIYLMVKAKKIEESKLSKTVKTFAKLYIAVFVIHFFLLVFYKKIYILCFMYPFWVFFLHIPPLFFLWHFLVGYTKIHPLQPIDKKELNSLFNKNKISEREQEIIELLLKGKSNQEIEDELYISLSTVKTHIYNIYKKLGVKSRWQLFNLVQNRDKNYNKQGRTSI